jgi:hypothetical protein
LVVVTVRCEIVRWVSDEPQPGWVEARLIDAHGHEHVFFDKSAMFETGRPPVLTASSAYPVAGVIRAEVVGTYLDRDGAEILEVRLRDVETQAGTFQIEVTREQLIEPG